MPPAPTPPPATPCNHLRAPRAGLLLDSQTPWRWVWTTTRCSRAATRSSCGWRSPPRCASSCKSSARARSRAAAPSPGRLSRRAARRRAQRGGPPSGVLLPPHPPPPACPSSHVVRETRACSLTSGFARQRGDAPKDYGAKSFALKDVEVGVDDSFGGARPRGGRLAGAFGLQPDRSPAAPPNRRHHHPGA